MQFGVASINSKGGKGKLVHIMGSKMTKIHIKILDFLLSQSQSQIFIEYKRVVTCAS